MGKQVVGQSKPFEGQSAGKVLVVEDNDVNAMVLIEMMKLVGSKLTIAVEIEVAKTAEEARQKWPKDGESMVLLDINLPDGRGDEVCKDMTQDASMHERPFVVCVSANVSHMHAESMRSFGIDRCLPKPVHVPLLAEHVMEWNRRRVD
jgi:CheY-like chemotaxis protein